MEGYARTAAASKLITSRTELAALVAATPELTSAIIENPATFYTEFQIPKPNGDRRTIRPPKRRLRVIQRLLLQELYKRVRIPPYLHGGIPRRSAITHARCHVGRRMVATLDVRKFFPSTTADHIRPVLQALGFVGEALEDVIRLLLLENELAQGAPTSSLLANLAFSIADKLYVRVCKRHGLIYSRYVDDIAISGDHDFHNLRGPFVDFIGAARYEVAENKVKFVPSAQRQVVTGLVVNECLRPTKEYVRELKNTIRLCIQIGPYPTAIADGLTVLELQRKLSGKVAHVAQSDKKLARRLRGLLCGIEWSSQRSKHSLCSASSGFAD